MKEYIVHNDQVSYLDNYYFDEPKAMPGADAETFEQIGRWFGRDRHHVYFLHAIVEEADPISFVVLGGYNDFWAKDREHAFHFRPSKSARNIRALQSQSLDRFAILPACRFDEYAGDA